MNEAKAGLIVTLALVGVTLVIIVAVIAAIVWGAISIFGV